MLVSKSFARRAVRAAKAIQDEVNATLGPTPEQRAQLAREAESDDIKLNGVGLAILERRVAEQSALITGQRAAIDKLEARIDNHQGHVEDKLEELRVWVQERADGVSNLGMRLGKLEDAESDFEKHVHARLMRLETQAKRVREQYPSVAEPTIAEQDAATGPREEGDGD